MRKIILFCLLIPIIGMAQNNVVSTFRAFPKADKVLEFEKALATHAQKYHTGNWKWRVFAIQSGPDANGYHITEGPLSWDMIDGRGDLSVEHNNDWNKNVAIYLTERGAASYSVFQDTLSTVMMTDYADKINITHSPNVTSLQESFRGVSAVALPAEFNDPSNHTSGIVSFAAGPDGKGSLQPAMAAERQAGSLLWLRLGEGDSALGYLCIDSTARREWTPGDLRSLAMASGVVTTALRRLKAESDREQLQGQLQQGLKMEAVGKLSGGIAHDFNNMLLPIIGYSDMILLRLPDNDPSVPELREIKRAAERATALTRQLLAFSRKQVAKKTVFDLNENLGHMTRMLGRIIGEDIHLRMALSPEPVPVRADQGQIEQIVMNLIINARDAMPSGGAITVRTMLVDATLFPVPLIGGSASAGSFAVLTVTDTGCGIPEDLMDHIFEPFFTTKGKEGTGLGLSVIYGILQDHQGGIQLTSTPGKGTSFHIFLPATGRGCLTPVAETVSDKGTVAKYRGQGQRVLLVEDEEAVNHLVRTALAQNGYTVTAAANAKEARARFDESSGQFDMIFSDAVLPDGNGLQLLDSFLTTNPALRALLSSGYTDKNSLLEMARHRRISFLPKPYSLPELFQTVAEVMEDQGTHLLD